MNGHVFEDHKSLGFKRNMESEICEGIFPSVQFITNKQPFVHTRLYSCYLFNIIDLSLDICTYNKLFSTAFFRYN